MLTRKFLLSFDLLLRLQGKQILQCISIQSVRKIIASLTLSNVLRHCRNLAKLLKISRIAKAARRHFCRLCSELGCRLCRLCCSFCSGGCVTLQLLHLTAQNANLQFSTDGNAKLHRMTTCRIFCVKQQIITYIVVIYWENLPIFQLPCTEHLIIMHNSLLYSATVNIDVVSQ